MSHEVNPDPNNLFEEQECPHLSEEEPVFVDQDGIQYDIHYAQTKTQKEFALSKLPLPQRCQKYDVFYRLSIEWSSEIKKQMKTLLLPVPISSYYMSPRPPHVPSDLEKDKTSKAYRIARQTFKVDSTPLYPQNQLHLIDICINEHYIPNSDFPQPGPSYQTIPLTHHFQNSLPLFGQMIPQKPRPEMYENFAEYSDAVIQWAKITSGKHTLPSHPTIFKETLNLEVQAHNSNIFHESQLAHPTLMKYGNASFKNEIQAKALLVGMQHLYTSTILPYGKSFRNMAPIKICFTRGLEPCTSIYDELCNYGPTGKLCNPRLCAGIAFRSYKSLVTIKRNVDVSAVKRILDTASALNSETMVSERYSLFLALCQIFNTSANTIADFIVCNSEALRQCAGVMAEFCDDIYSLPNFLSIPDTVFQDSGLLLTFQHVFVSLRLCHQLKILFDSPSFGGRRSREFIATKVMELESTATMLLDSQNSLLLAKSLCNVVKEKVDVQLELLHDIIGSQCNTKSLFVFLKSFEPNIFCLLDHIANEWPSAFARFYTRVIYDYPVCLTMKEFLQQSILQGDSFLSLNNNEHFLTFISQLVSSDAPNNSPSNSAAWILVFLTNMVSIGQIGASHGRAIQACCQFASRNLNNLSWDNAISDICSILLPYLQACAPEVAIYVLSGLRLLVWHSSSSPLFQTMPASSSMIAKQIASQDLETSIQATRLFRVIIIHHPAFLQALVNDPFRLDEIGKALYTRNWLRMVETLKIIMKIPHTSYAALVSILASARFKVESALSMIRASADPRHAHVASDFEKFLNSQQALKSMLENHRKNRSKTNLIN